MRLAGNASCTTNFLFTNPHDRTLFLGSAAHCFQAAGADNVRCDHEHSQPLPPGTPVEFALQNATYSNRWLNGTDPHHTRAPVRGTLAYNSWYTMLENGESPRSLACAHNDFALIQLPAGAHRLTTPSFPGLGNATGLATPEELEFLAPVNQYGNSRYWSEAEQAKHKSGFITQEPQAATDDWYFHTTVAAPAFFGDSGSAILLSDGKAAGVFVNFATNSGPPTPLGAPPIPGLGTGKYLVLSTALDYLHEHTDLLVTIVDPHG